MFYPRYVLAKKWQHQGRDFGIRRSARYRAVPMPRKNRAPVLKRIRDGRVVTMPFFNIVIAAIFASCPSFERGNVGLSLCVIFILIGILILDKNKVWKLRVSSDSCISLIILPSKKAIAPSLSSSNFPLKWYRIMKISESPEELQLAPIGRVIPKNESHFESDFR